MHGGNLLTRDDTFFGVCQGLGEDLGFSPNWLRIGLALLLFWSPMAAVGAYAGMGALVAATRLVVREPKAPPVPEPELGTVEAEAPTEQAELPLAA